MSHPSAHSASSNLASLDHYVKCRNIKNSSFFDNMLAWYQSVSTESSKHIKHPSFDKLFDYCAIHKCFEYKVDNVDEANTRLLSPKSEICNVCRNELVLQVNVKSDDIAQARNIWIQKYHELEELEDQIDEGQHHAQNMENYLDQLCLKEYTSWIQYTFCCFNIGEKMRELCQKNPHQNFAHKSVLEARHCDSIIRNDIARDYMFCTKHQSLGDAWPWRNETLNYNQECFICFEGSSRRQSLQKTQQTALLDEEKIEPNEHKCHKSTRRLSTHMFTSD